MSSALVLENISFSYEQNEIFSDLNYTFNTGNIYSIMGSNGEGKTTLLNLIYGELTFKKQDQYVYRRTIKSKN